MRRISLLLALAALAATAAVLAQDVVGARTGPLPLVGVFEVHLLAFATAGALLGLPAALGEGRVRGSQWLRLLLTAVVVLGVVRLGDELWSPGSEAPAGGLGSGTGEPIRVLSWNLEMESKTGAQVVDGIAAMDADLVALQELTPDYAAAIEADPGLRARYPYRVMDPRPAAEGLGVLARRPLLVRGRDERSRLLRAGLLLADGRTAELFVVHPSRPLYATTFSIPRSLDTRRRDQDLARIRDLVDRLDAPSSALLVGDFNASPTEPGLGVLEAGLTDAHRAVGTGPGFTWRPDPVEATNLGLLRIDGVRTGDWYLPRAIAEDCTAIGDHCRLLVTLEVVPPSGD